MRLQAWIVVAGLVASAGCTLDKQGAPPLTGPSGLALALDVTATPDVLVRDGVSTAVIDVTARNATGQPVPGLTVYVATQIGLGTLSANSATTNSAGRASVVYTAPGAGNDITTTLTITPVGTNNQNAQGRTVAIRLVRP